MPGTRVGVPRPSYAVIDPCFNNSTLAVGQWRANLARWIQSGRRDPEDIRQFQNELNAHARYEANSKHGDTSTHDTLVSLARAFGIPPVAAEDEETTRAKQQNALDRQVAGAVAAAPRPGVAAAGGPGAAAGGGRGPSSGSTGRPSTARAPLRAVLTDFSSAPEDVTPGTTARYDPDADWKELIQNIIRAAERDDTTITEEIAKEARRFGIPFSENIVRNSNELRGLDKRGLRAGNPRRGLAAGPGVADGTANETSGLTTEIEPGSEADANGLLWPRRVRVPRAQARRSRGTEEGPVSSSGGETVVEGNFVANPQRSAALEAAWAPGSPLDRAVRDAAATTGISVEDLLGGPMETPAQNPTGKPQGAPEEQPPRLQKRRTASERNRLSRLRANTLGRRAQPPPREESRLAFRPQFNDERDAEFAELLALAGRGDQEEAPGSPVDGIGQRLGESASGDDTATPEDNGPEQGVQPPDAGDGNDTSTTLPGYTTDNRGSGPPVYVPGTPPNPPPEYATETSLPSYSGGEGDNQAESAASPRSAPPEDRQTSVNLDRAELAGALSGRRSAITDAESSDAGDTDYGTPVDSDGGDEGYPDAPPGPQTASEGASGAPPPPPLPPPGSRRIPGAPPAPPPPPRGAPGVAQAGGATGSDRPSGPPAFLAELLGFGKDKLKKSSDFTASDSVDDGLNAFQRNLKESLARRANETNAAAAGPPLSEEEKRARLRPQEKKALENLEKTVDDLIQEVRAKKDDKNPFTLVRPVGLLKEAIKALDKELKRDRLKAYEIPSDIAEIIG